MAFLKILFFALIKRSYLSSELKDLRRVRSFFGSSITLAAIPAELVLLLLHESRRRPVGSCGRKNLTPIHLAMSPGSVIEKLISSGCFLGEWLLQL